MQTSDLALFPMPNVEDIAAHLLSQDLIWVGGGSVAGLLAMLGAARGWDGYAGRVGGRVVLGGVSAGSICWHVGGPTASSDLVAGGPLTSVRMARNSLP